MLFYTVGQSQIFLTMLYAGLLAGLYVSIDGAARRLFEAGRLFGALMDLILGVVLAAVACIALIIAADGELRLYSLMGLLAGFLIYMGTLHPLLIQLFRLASIPLRAVRRFLLRLSLVKKLLK